MINFEDVVIGYKKALFQVDIPHLETGNTIALIGANGSGKSTFLKTICQQIEPFSGTIQINNQMLDSYSKNELSKQLAFVPSRFPEISNITTYDFVGLGRTPYLTALGRLTTSDHAVVEHALKTLGLLKFSAKQITELSDGEKQLVAIARALAQETSIILLDEPTSFLDFRNKEKIISLLQKLSIETKKLIVFSSHDLETLIRSQIQKIGISLSAADAAIPKLELVTEVDLNKVVDMYY